jgi:hypothetical protein
MCELQADASIRVGLATASTLKDNAYHTHQKFESPCGNGFPRFWKPGFQKSKGKHPPFVKGPAGKKKPIYGNAAGNPTFLKAVPGSRLPEWWETWFVTSPPACMQGGL